MSNEIKQGDTVRVSTDAPRETRLGEVIPTSREFTVTAIGKNYAEIKLNGSLLPTYYPIPTKYLVKVDAEAKEAKFKVGDRVKFKNIYELQKVKDKSFRWMLVEFASKEATITEVEDNGFYRVDIDPSIGGINDDMIECKVEPTEQTEAKTKPKGETLTFPICVDLLDELECSDSFVSIRERMRKALKEVEAHNKPRYVPKIMFNTEYWVKYEADLAKEVALKVANKYNSPNEAAEYAVSVAKAVVEWLKRK